MTRIKLSKTFLLIAFLVACTLGVGVFYVLPSWVEHKIQQAAGNSQVALSYDKMEVSIIRRQVSCLGMEVKGDLQTASGRWAFQHQAKALHVRQIRWLKLLRSTFHVSEVQWEAPQINLERDTSGKVRADTASGQSGKQFRFEIGRLYAQNGQFIYTDTQDTTARATIDTFSLAIGGIAYQSGEGLSSKVADCLSFNFRSCTMPDRAFLHQISLQQLSGDSRDSTLSIKALSVQSLHGANDFARQMDYRKGRYALQLPALQVEGLGYKALLRDSLHAHSITLESPQLRVVMDKRVPHDSSRQKSLPHTWLSDLGRSVRVDEIRLRQADIQYAELYAGHEELGTVDFKNLNASIHTVGNDADFSPITLEVECSFYGEAPLYLSAQFPVNDPGAPFRYNARLEQFPLPRANAILAEAAGFRFKSGMVDELTLNAVANAQQVEGEMRFFYKDLDIQYLDSDSKLVKKILNGVVEGLAFPQENLAGEKHRLGKIHADRDDSRSVFHYLWQSALSGIKSTILPNLVLPEELKHTNVEPEEDGLRH
jgi:hypothetical protein